MRRPWLIIAIVLGVVLFAVGVSHEAYDLFSPPALTWFLALRKLESVVAFYVLGYALDRAILESRRPLRSGTGGVSIALYSAALEVAQGLHGSHEGLMWNAIDVLCGCFGGALADVTIEAQRRRRRPPLPKRRRGPR